MTDAKKNDNELKIIEKIMEESINVAMSGIESYDGQKVHEWKIDITKICLSKLINYSKNNKYIVQCILIQKSSSGIHTSCNSYWNANTDKSYIVTWDNKEMRCILNVFVLGL